jgi:hypothetical protein
MTDDNIPGYRWITFRGGHLDGVERLLREPIEHGDRYNRVVPHDETWEYNQTTGEMELVTSTDPNHLNQLFDQ